MLQWNFWLGLLFLSSELPASLCLTLVNTTLNATPSDRLDRPPDMTVCVNNIQHQTWGGSLEDFHVGNCRRAVELIAEKVKDRTYTSYDFYSRQVYPSGPGTVGYEAWPLPQGASSG